MSSVGGNTTVTEAASAASVDSQEATLLWLFPRSSAPVALHGGRKRELTIGRDEASAVCLTGNDVSRRHAVLHIDPGSPDSPGSGVRIADLGSRNGVRVNGRPVSEAQIGVGDVVRLGGWVGVVAASAGAFTEIAPGLWGGATLQAALAPLRTAAASDLPIVLEGETGTGKELATRALHRWSGRSGPLSAVNCAALPEGLAEGELFGYRRGAFTGADRASAGFFRGAQVERCCWTRSRTCRSGCRPSCCASSRSARCSRSVRFTRSRSTCAWWSPGSSRSSRRCGRGAFGPICWRASTA